MISWIIAPVVVVPILLIGLLGRFVFDDPVEYVRSALGQIAKCRYCGEIGVCGAGLEYDHKQRYWHHNCCKSLDTLVGDKEADDAND